MRAWVCGRPGSAGGCGCECVHGALLEQRSELPPSLAAAELPRPTPLRLQLFIGVHCGDRGGTVRGWGVGTRGVLEAETGRR